MDQEQGQQSQDEAVAHTQVDAKDERDQPQERAQRQPDEQAKPDDSEPTPERQTELRAAYEKNVASGKPPYAGANIRTRGEVNWLVRERGWNGSAYVGTTVPESAGYGLIGTIDLSEADLSNAILRGADFWGASLRKSVLIGTDLSNASLTLCDMAESDARGSSFREARLFRASLHNINLFEADLARAYCDEVDLSGAELRRASLRNAILWGANLSGARLSESDLTGADLRDTRMDYLTLLHEATLSSDTWLGDIAWNGVLLARIDWKQVKRLGDEKALAGGYSRQKQRRAALREDELRAAARAYRGLALALRSQGLHVPAMSYRSREQQLERAALRAERKYGSWLFSWLLNLVSGYGDKPGRALYCYLAVVGAFTGAYWALTNQVFGFIQSESVHLAWYEALVLSISSFHGRGFFPSILTLGDPIALIAAVEAVVGLFIELVFIATFTQRFFTR